MFLVPTGRYPLEVELELFEETLPTSMRLRVGDERVPWRLMASNERDDESWVCGPRLVIARPLRASQELSSLTTRDHHREQITRQLIAGQRPSDIVRERQREHLSNEAILALFKAALGIPFHHFEETMRSVLEPAAFEPVDFDMAAWALLRVSENIP